MKNTRVLRITAWGVLFFIAIGYVSLVPSISQRLDAFEASSVGRATVSIALVAWVADAVLLWLSAIVYSWQRSKREGTSKTPVLILILTNFMGALVYYFAFVRRHGAESGPRRV